MSNPVCFRQYDIYMKFMVIFKFTTTNKIVIESFITNIYNEYLMKFLLKIKQRNSGRQANSFSFHLSISFLSVRLTRWQRCRKYDRPLKFKSWSRLPAFKFAPLPLLKWWIYQFLAQAWLIECRSEYFRFDITRSLERKLWIQTVLLRLKMILCYYLLKAGRVKCTSHKFQKF